MLFSLVEPGLWTRSMVTRSCLGFQYEQSQPRYPYREVWQQAHLRRHCAWYCLCISEKWYVEVCETYICGHLCVTSLLLCICFPNRWVSQSQHLLINYIWIYVSLSSSPTYFRSISCPIGHATLWTDSNVPKLRVNLLTKPSAFFYFVQLYFVIFNKNYHNHYHFIVLRCGGQLLNVTSSFSSARCIRCPGVFGAQVYSVPSIFADQFLVVSSTSYCWTGYVVQG